MKLVWSPEKASKAYIDTVKSCEIFKESSVAELISAMAAGWDAQMIVETWSRGGIMATSIGLAVASHVTRGRHICLVPDEDSRIEYIQAMEHAGMSPEVVVREPEEAMEGLMGIDFLVVDCRRNDFCRILRVAKLGHRGAVLICKNASSRVESDFRWRSVLDGKSRIVRSVFLPVGKGLDIAHVGATVSGGGKGGSEKNQSRWIRHFDRESGEEFVIRK
ncbi:uncharacterized protein LOC107828533 [Nicotiana tabacum]|uniref:Uncharacterized protein LOC107828533 n=2 Tax=Nicotiana TaxID=4085 RepID=A0A1S4DD67_TOBAC|nr:PREDICTED: uncharacterized protein LOC104218871 [Nicotiana sylvestris]XP_016511346.1 PREDICTED: uncharacterized protein LOC107828533 [Nicotiana tabacum]